MPWPSPRRLWKSPGTRECRRAGCLGDSLRTPCRQTAIGRKVYLAQGSKHAQYVEATFAQNHSLELSSLVLEIFEMDAEQPITQQFDYFDGILARADEMPKISTGADARIVPFDRVNDVDRFVVLMVRTVIVDCDADIEFCDQSVEIHKRVGRGVCCDDFRRGRPVWRTRRVCDSRRRLW